MKSILTATIGIIVYAFSGSAFAAPATQLTLVKEVVGGEAATTDWVLTADGTGGNDLSGAGGASGYIAPDTFALTESAGPPGYEAGAWDCVGGGSLVDSNLTLFGGEDVTCTIVNTYAPPPVIFDTDLALPSMPAGGGAGTPVCIDDVSGLLVAGCDVTITADEIDPTSVQRRVGGTCRSGYLISAINEDGSVACEPDIDTNAATLCGSNQFLDGNGSCTSADAAGECAAGAVCLGGHTHDYVPKSGSDAVIGGNYTHDARTGYLHVAGSALIPSSHLYEYTRTYDGYIRPSGSYSFLNLYSPVDLPDGATVKNITFFAYDNDASTVTPTYRCELRSRLLTSSVSNSVISRELAINWVASTSVRSSTQSGGTHVIDKSSRAYFLYAVIAGTGGSPNFRHYGCRIGYEYSNTNN